MGVALRSASPVDSGIFFATSFARMSPARRHAEGGQGVFPVLLLGVLQLCSGSARRVAQVEMPVNQLW